MTHAASWLASQSLHAERPAPQPAPDPTAAPVDTRPRRDYLLPSGAFVTIILHHGDVPAPVITYALAGGAIVNATLAPIQRAEVEWLLSYACGRERVDQHLRYLAYAALAGRSSRAAFVELYPHEIHAAIRGCADALQMIRAMGGGPDGEQLQPIGGGR